MTWDEFVAQHERLGELVAAFRADQERTGGGGTPCCHWGRHSSDLEQVVVAYCLMFEDATGDDYTDPELMDAMVGLFVNDGDGAHAYYIIRDRHVLPDGFFDYLDTDRFTDEDEGLKVRLGIANRVASKAWAALHSGLECEGPIDLTPIFQASVDVMWSEIFDYWDEKEDA